MTDERGSTKFVAPALKGKKALFELFVVRMAKSLADKVDLKRKDVTRSLFIRSAIATDLRAKKIEVQPDEIDVPGDKRRLPRERPRVNKTASKAGEQSVEIVRLVVRIPLPLAMKIDRVRRETRSQYVRNAIANELKRRQCEVTDAEILAPDRARRPFVVDNEI
jgi:metal-responsive CopG/Arc/MetJ family transcriptional regulator